MVFVDVQGKKSWLFYCFIWFPILPWNFFPSYVLTLLHIGTILLVNLFVAGIECRIGFHCVQHNSQFCVFLVQYYFLLFCQKLTITFLKYVSFEEISKHWKTFFHKLECGWLASKFYLRLFGGGGTSKLNIDIVGTPLLHLHSTPLTHHTPNSITYLNWQLNLHLNSS